MSMSIKNDESYPCALCSKEVVTDAIQCDICGLWVHRICAKLTKKTVITEK